MSTIPPLMDNSPPPLVKKDIQDDSDDNSLDFDASFDIPSPPKNLSLPSTPDSIQCNETVDVPNQQLQITEPSIDTNAAASEVVVAEFNVEDDFDDFADFQAADIYSASPSTSNIVGSQEEKQNQVLIDHIGEVIKSVFGPSSDFEIVDFNGPRTVLDIETDEFFNRIIDFEESEAFKFRFSGSCCEKCLLTALEIDKGKTNEETKKDEMTSKLPNFAVNLSEKPLEPIRVSDVVNESRSVSQPPMASKSDTKARADLDCEFLKAFCADQTTEEQRKSISNIKHTPDQNGYFGDGVLDKTNPVKVCEEIKLNEPYHNSDDDEWSDFVFNKGDDSSTRNTDDEWSDFISIKTNGKIS